MINPPKTASEARAYRYGVWGGAPGGKRYEEGKCAYELVDGTRIPRQCSCSAKHGPGNLYCLRHAKIVSSTERAKWTGAINQLRS